MFDVMSSYIMRTTIHKYNADKGHEINPTGNEPR